MRRRTFLQLAGSAGASLSTFPAVVGAQVSWPNKPVKFIVPFGAGGGTDNLARFWAERLADALNDLLAGTVHFMNDPTTNPSAKAGKLKMLCVNHSTRSPEFPDVPTLTEAGYPNSDVPLWFASGRPQGCLRPSSQPFTPR